MAVDGTVPTSGPRTAAQFAGDINEELAALWATAFVQLGSVSSTNTITAAASPAGMFTAYAAGQKFAFQAAADNTDAVTLNINSIGAKNLRTAAGADLVAGQLVTGTLYAVEVVAIAGPDVEFRLIGSGGGASGSGTPDVLVPFTSSGSFAKGDYPGARQFVVTAIGPGGNGGPASTIAGGGGGAGGVAIKRFVPADLASSITVTINSSKAEFAHTTPVVGNAGSVGTGTGGAGGSASGGDLNFTGPAGQDSSPNNTDGAQGGDGGSPVGTMFGRGGFGGSQAVSAGAGGNGTNGSGYGGGGGGAGSRNASSSDGSPGSGAPGAVFVEIRY